MPRPGRRSQLQQEKSLMSQGRSPSAKSIVSARNASCQRLEPRSEGSRRRARPPHATPVLKGQSPLYHVLLLNFYLFFRNFLIAWPFTDRRQRRRDGECAMIIA